MFERLLTMDDLPTNLELSTVNEDLEHPAHISEEIQSIPPGRKNLTFYRSCACNWGRFGGSVPLYGSKIKYFNHIQAVLALPTTAWYVIGNVLMRPWEPGKLVHWASVHYATAGRLMSVIQSPAPTLCLHLVADFLPSPTTAWSLLKNRKHVLPQTSNLLNALVRLTFQTAALPAICVMINLIFVCTGDNYSKNVFIQALPYAIGMMWTLNARRAIRVAFASGGNDGTSTEEAVPRNVERTRRTQSSRQSSPYAFVQSISRWDRKLQELRDLEPIR
ncbi:hypothetical protein EDD85DRAFT_937143 [Armillaria nabsnona]|nr:hypothetical protein EDD85DRAFT_937143 [Armillaria nabsnona]